MNIEFDYKQDYHHLGDWPKPEDLFTALSGGKQFTKLDLQHAYQQLRLEDSAKDLVTINTHKGLYQYNRLPFGVASAPAIFQRTMDIILQGLSGVICYIDDILITGSSDKEHLANLEEVFETSPISRSQVKIIKMSLHARLCGISGPQTHWIRSVH